MFKFTRSLKFTKKRFLIHFDLITSESLSYLYTVILCY